MSNLDSVSVPTRKLPRGILLSAISLVVLAGLLASYHYTQGRAEKKLAATVSSIKTAGMPTSAAELDAWYAEPPVNENAAIHYVQAFNIMVGVPLRHPWFDSQSQSNIFNSTNPIPPQARADLRDYIATNQPALALIREGGKWASARYPITLSGGHNVHLDHLPRHRNAVRLCNLTALHHALEGRMDATIDSLTDALHLGRSLSQEPVLVSHLTQISGYLLTVQMIENILCRTSIPPDLSRRLRQELEDAAASLHLDRALAGERSMSMDFFQDAGAFTGGAKPAFGQSMMASLYEMSGIKYKDLSAYLHFMEKSVEAGKKPPSVMPAAFRQIENEFLELNTERSWSMVITSMMLPALLKTGIKNTDAQAKLRLAQLALAINEYQAVNSGKLPETLSQLDESVIDPYDGKPLRYRLTGTDYELWSVGPDGIDQGGKTKPKGSSSEAYDIVFTVEKR